MNANLKMNALLLAMCLCSSILLSGCDDDGETKDPFPEATAATKGLCNLAVQCGVMSSAELNQCIHMEELRALTTYVIDSKSFTSCLRQTNCAWIEDDNDYLLEDCIRLDNSSFACNASDTELHYCNIDGNCVDINCAEACDYGFNTRNASCGFMSDDAHDKCLCYLK